MTAPLSCLRAGHPGVEFEQLFEPLGIVPKTAADVNALQHRIVMLMRMAEVFGHRLRIIKICDGRREMRFTGEEDARAQYTRVALLENGDSNNSDR